MRRKSVRKVIATVAGVAVALSLAACGGSGDGGGGGDKGTIGVAMPTVFYIIWGVMEIVGIPIAK